MNPTPADPHLLGLLKKDPVAIREIYLAFAPRIENMVYQHGGNQEDARDVFQEALIVVWRKAQEPGFELSSSFYTYLYGVCYYIWQRQRKKKDNNTVTFSGVAELSSEINIQQELENSERKRIFQQHFKRLGKDCQQLLQLFFAGTKMQKIASLLAIESEHAARNRKYRCQKKLEDSILNDPRYGEINEGL